MECATFKEPLTVLNSLSERIEMIEMMKYPGYPTSKCINSLMPNKTWISQGSCNDLSKKGKYALIWSEILPFGCLLKSSLSLISTACFYGLSKYLG